LGHCKGDFTHCAAITRDLVRFQQESRIPETFQPKTREPEALEGTDHPEGFSSGVIESHLVQVVDLHRNSGREITSDLLSRFRLMAARCDQAARAIGATGGDWLAEALIYALGVAQPRNLLNYADAVINDWISNRHEEKHAGRMGKTKSTQREFIKANREPEAHAGIRKYLEKHGGIPDGYRD
jgi:hypothetical protein